MKHISLQQQICLSCSNQTYISFILYPVRTVTSLPTKIQYCQGREGPLLLFVQVHCHDQQIIVFCHFHPASWNLPVLPRPKVQYTSCTEE